jgi:hypothetical protein
MFAASAGGLGKVTGTGTNPGGQDGFQICPDKPGNTDAYALCATAQCFFLGERGAGVAYCKCDLMNGESISTPFEFESGDRTQNVCDLLDQGVENGFTVSTYSPPPQVLADYDTSFPDGPPLALYTCPGGSTGPYAQCDGGVCFTSTEGSQFPGFSEPLADGEIICSCPITIPRRTLPGHEPRLGYQIAGPWEKNGEPCPPGDKDPECCSRSFWDEFCFADGNPDTGATIPVGAPTGSAALLSVLLYGPPIPDVNRCSFWERQGRFRGD